MCEEEREFVNGAVGWVSVRSQDEEKTASKIELRPCPFCGTLDTVRFELGRYVSCHMCAGEWISLDKWQSRPIEDALHAQVKSLKEEVASLQEEIQYLYDDMAGESL